MANPLVKLWHYLTAWGNATIDERADPKIQVAQAIEAGGSTLADTQYVDVEGQGGWFQLHHRVYDRAGQRCLTCGRADIVRVVSGGRSTCYCPRCQH